MSKLVAYFSCTGITKKLAEEINEIVGGTLYEIKAERPYTPDDINYMNPNSRCTYEMSDKSSRPAIIKDLDNMDEYDTIYVGFPIWWYQAPTIINTFLESYDLTGKVIKPFATSGSSNYGNSNKYLETSVKGALLKEGIVLNKPTKEEITKWINEG